MNKLRTAHVFCLSTSIELLAEVLTDTLSHQVTLALVLSILVIVWYRDYRRSTAGLMMTISGTNKALRHCR